MKTDIKRNLRSVMEKHQHSCDWKGRKRRALFRERRISLCTVSKRRVVALRYRARDVVLMQRQQEIFWITLGQPDDGNEKGFEQVQRHIENILDALKRKAKKRGWSYTIYGTIANVHISGTEAFERDFGIEIEPELCRYHVHLIVMAEPGHTIAQDSRDKWRYGTRREMCIKYGKGSQGIFNLAGLFRYVRKNHDRSTRARWIVQRVPSRGRASRDSVMQDIRNGYANLPTHSDADTLPIAQDGARLRE